MTNVQRNVVEWTEMSYFPGFFADPVCSSSCPCLPQLPSRRSETICSAVAAAAPPRTYLVPENESLEVRVLATGAQDPSPPQFMLRYQGESCVMLSTVLALSRVKQAVSAPRIVVRHSDAGLIPATIPGDSHLCQSTGGALRDAVLRLVPLVNWFALPL